MSVSPSGSTAETGVPILTPGLLFSVTDRVVLLPSVNTGASFTFVIFTVTSMDAVPPFPSLAVIVTL